MTQLQTRAFIFADEWLWIGVLAWLHARGETWWFAGVFGIGAVANWWLAYRSYWRRFPEVRR